MLVSNDKNLPFPRISDFYDKKCIFLTGASGFVGVVLLEALLSCCPGIRSIFILLRSRKGKQPDERKESLLKKKLFDKLREENPDALKKIFVIPGDVSLPNLGMSEQDYAKVLQEANIVFHCASATHFNKPHRFMLKQNCVGVENVIELCERMNKLEVLVYTSTVFSNANRKSKLLEKVYRLPFPAQTFMEEFRTGTDESFQKLLTHCEPEWPNAYMFSKALAENIIMDKAPDFPVAIIRPSIVFNVWKSPLPGFIELTSAATAVMQSIAKGFVKVMCIDGEYPVDVIPVDLVVRHHIVCAWSIATGRLASPLVCNSTTFNLISERSVYNIVLELFKAHPVPNSVQKLTGLVFVSNTWLYWLLAAWYHFIPALALDCILRMQGKKARIFKAYRFFDKTFDVARPCLRCEWDPEKKIVLKFDELLHPADKDVFYVNPTDAKIDQLFKSIPNGAAFCDWSTAAKSPQEERKALQRRHLLITAVQWLTLIFFCCFIYVLTLLCYRLVLTFFIG